MLEKLKKDIDISLKSYIKEAADDVELKSSSPLLYGGIMDFLCRDGKRIRPLLFLISYLGYTKRKKFSYKKLLRSSTSMELLHDFLLIHDDVIDKSDLRRGKPTLHRHFNSKLKISAKDELGGHLSIVAGDIIFAMAVEALFASDECAGHKERALSIFTKMAMSTGIGEFLDVANGLKKIDQIAQKDIFLIYTLKTAKYTFEGPLLVGGALAGIQSKEAKKLSALGITLGKAFQIQDDLLDIFSSSKKTGKPVLSDLDESKKTLLAWKAYKDCRGTNKKLFKELLGKNKKSRSDLLKLKKLIKSSNAGKYCLKSVKDSLLKADNLSSSLNMKLKYKNLLRQFVAGLIKKNDILEKNI